MLDSSRDTIGITLKKLGYSLNTTNKEELEKAKEELIKQKPLVSSYQVDYYKTALIGGEADMSLWFLGHASIEAIAMGFTLSHRPVSSLR